MENDKRQVLKLSPNKEWTEINFVDIKKGDTIRLKEPDGEVVSHEDGRTSFVATSDAYICNFGHLCFEFDDESTEK